MTTSPYHLMSCDISPTFALRPSGFDLSDPAGHEVGIALVENQARGRGGITQNATR